MMTTIKLLKVDDVYLKVIAEPSTIMEMSEYFTFFVKGAQFSPKFKNKIWDGKLRLLNRITCQIYLGLLYEIELFCHKRNYDIEIDTRLAASEFSLKEAEEFISTLNLPFPVRDYQLKSFVTSVRERRLLLLSPTGSGKSLLTYLLARYYNVPVLIIVPRIDLVNQLTTDFKDYRYDSDTNVHKIYSGQDKITDKLITITTWQSVFNFPKEFFNKYKLIIGDEAHLFSAKALVSLMTKTTECPVKIGLTGTLDESKTNELVLQGLFGRVEKVTTTAELIEQGYLAELKIKAILLQYPDTMKKEVSKMQYKDEYSYIIAIEARNRFIKNLALSLKGNTLVVFDRIDKHGKILYESILNEIKEKYPNRQVHYIHGGIDAKDREEVRFHVNDADNDIICASFGTYQVGINIPNLHNAIFASPSKGRIRNLQTIGRILRKSSNGEPAQLFDIGDNLQWKSKHNTTLLHFINRIELYNEQKFNYKIYNVSLNI